VVILKKCGSLVRWSPGSKALAKIVLPSGGPGWLTRLTFSRHSVPLAMELSSLSSTRAKALLEKNSSNQHGAAATAAHGTLAASSPPRLPYVRYDVSTMAHVACGCAVVVDHRIGGAATAAVPLSSTSPPVLLPQPSSAATTNTSSNIPLDEWQAFTSQLEAMVRPLVRLETTVVTTVLPSLCTLAYATPYLLDWMAIPFSSSVPLIFVVWIVMAVTLLVVTIHVEQRRLQTWHALQEVCSSNGMSTNNSTNSSNSANKQAQLFDALGWAMECHYEWWTTSRGRSMGGANRGFRLYLHPISTQMSTNMTSTALADTQSLTTTTTRDAWTMQNGYVRIPVNSNDNDDMLPPLSMPSMPLGFESLASSAVWARLWSEMKTLTTVVRCCRPLALNLRHVVWSLGGASLLTFAIAVTLALNDMNFVMLWIGAALLSVAFVVAACIQSSQFHKRRHLTSRADYVQDFAQLGYHVEHRTVAYPSTTCSACSTSCGLCNSLQFGHYLYVYQLPAWSGGSTTGATTV
jgi:hypothetical protein